MREAGSGTRMAAEAHFEAAGFEPRVVMSLGSNEAIKHAVASGLGIAVLSQLAAQNALASDAAGDVATGHVATSKAAAGHAGAPRKVKSNTNVNANANKNSGAKFAARAGPAQPLAIIPVTGFPIQRRWSVVWRKDQALSVAAKRFVEYLQSP
jgi:LysR family transcriptional regulator, low CO2-responsive transcriptional regulator